MDFHYLGADSRELIEMIGVISLSDLENIFSKNDALLERYHPDEVKRKEFLDSYRKAVAIHQGDIYINVPSLSK